FVGLPPAADGGPIANTAVGTVTPTKATGETTATMKQVNLLDGMITTDLVKADVHGTNDRGTRTFGTDGSHFVNLVINGQGGTDNVKPGTKIDLPGIGTVFLYQIVRTPHSIQVTMIEVKVLQKNQLHLPVGTDIKVSVAKVSAY